MSSQLVRLIRNTARPRLALLGLVIQIGLLSALSERPAAAQSPGGNLGALLARLQADEANIASMQGTITSLQSTVTSQQNTINQMASSGVKPAGPAGGDLNGSYPSPTVAANAIDHTKLAQDGASLAQVSGGLLSNPDGYHFNVQHDLGVHGTVIGLNGNGGGNGSNNGDARALVDGGVPFGLLIDCANDFGQVTIGGPTTIQGDTNVVGHFSINGNVDATGYISAHSTLYGQSLQITGGSDLAEPYQIAAAAQVKPLPGMVVSIDPHQTGRMRVCARAYDATVGGIISGAGGVRPGVVLRQAGTVADGALPIASVGRVWCRCDAGANGPITPGDLLTTSDTPGHAMRVGDYDKAKGAVLGKAMSPLRSGKGLVLVLVSLQ